MVTAVPMTKGNKTARRIRCNILLSLSLLPSFLPRGPTNHGRPIKAVKFRPSVSHGTFVPSVYIARRTGREGEMEGGGRSQEAQARRCLSEKASHSLSCPSVRSEMAPMGSHESQIKWIVLVSFSPSQCGRGRCRWRGDCRFCPRCRGRRIYKRANDNGSIAATPHKASKHSRTQRETDRERKNFD